jgi:hypothetical protein
MTTPAKTPAARVVCRLILPIDVGPMSPNRTLGRHWSYREKHKKAAENTAYAIWHKAGKVRANGPVVVTYIIHRPRLLDGDNALAACKNVGDSLFKGRITPDDSPEWVTFNPVLQIVRPKWAQPPSLEVLVEEIG